MFWLSIDSDSDMAVLILSNFRESELASEGAMAAPGWIGGKINFVGCSRERGYVHQAFVHYKCFGLTIIVVDYERNWVNETFDNSKKELAGALS